MTVQGGGTPSGDSGERSVTVVGYTGERGGVRQGSIVGLLGEFGFSPVQWGVQI